MCVSGMYRFSRIRVGFLTVVVESPGRVSDPLAAVAELPSGSVVGWLMIMVMNGAGLDEEPKQHRTHNHLYSKVAGTYGHSKRSTETFARSRERLYVAGIYEAQSAVKVRSSNKHIERLSQMPARVEEGMP
jgi:hypothetical protein